MLLNPYGKLYIFSLMIKLVQTWCLMISFRSKSGMGDAGQMWPTWTFDLVHISIFITRVKV